MIVPGPIYYYTPILQYTHTGRPGQYCILLLLSLWNRVLIPTDIINIHPGTPLPVFFLKNMFLMNLKGVWQIYLRGHIISLPLTALLSRPASGTRVFTPPLPTSFSARHPATYVLYKRYAPDEIYECVLPLSAVSGRETQSARQYAYTHTSTKCTWINGDTHALLCVVPI